MVNVFRYRISDHEDDETLDGHGITSLPKRGYHMIFDFKAWYLGYNSTLHRDIECIESKINAPNTMVSYW